MVSKGEFIAKHTPGAVRNREKHFEGDCDGDAEEPGSGFLKFI
jgi:hypothetical protein